MKKRFYAELSIKEVVQNDKGWDEVKIAQYLVSGKAETIAEAAIDVWCRHQALELVSQINTDGEE
jgi:hypothetical protein